MDTRGKSRDRDVHTYRPSSTAVGVDFWTSRGERLAILVLGREGARTIVSGSRASVVDSGYYSRSH